ncbi:MAG: T9SS type A sorting domain-containing protein [Crocinitomicaceae bacterium]|nr:T9SS type A sorting domain-containing protein [Flavobacteriales bacterium]NQZ34911.1 T9SS type A sorting domain-containing protein [Crocinitomicaceae bacterium]
MKTIFTIITVLATVFSFGQVLETLDKNNVSLAASADGHLFNALASAGYEVPKGSGKHLIFSQSLWFGAKDPSGQLRIAAQRYAGDSTDFFPGPYSSNGSYDDPGYINEYIPALWKVSKADIDAHINEYASSGSVSNPHPTILNWPGNGYQALGVSPDQAPFVDLNSDGVYDPYVGDYPAIKGCEALYIIMNDTKSAAGGTGTASLGIEIHILMYQYASLDFLNDITFMDIRVINRGGTDLVDFVTASYTDADLGGFNDDYMGCDPMRNVVFTYNGDLYDEDNGSLGYGEGPPAVGVMYLNDTMSHAGYFTSTAAGPQSDPTTAAQYWNYMNGRWRFGDTWFFGGTGFLGSSGVTSIPTNHMFTGGYDPLNLSTGTVDPGFEWDETTNNNPPGDRRMFFTADQGKLLAGEELQIHQAIIYGRDSTKTSFENVDVMLEVADLVQAFYNSGMDVCNDPFASVSSLEEELFSVFPNPTNGKFTIDIPTITSELRVEVIDVYGQIVYSSPITENETQIDLKESSGLYFVTVIGNGSYRTTKLMLE